uniref:transcription factor bHLH143-like n=1 Tax=Erigeron canadensis TaxID=72917 RepID=UPI001CB90390|nr:transcription factor bHLH143-like [Erigeron canadensis]
MEKGFESWFQNQQIDLNLSSAPFGLWHRPSVPFLGSMLSPNMTDGNLPLFTFTASKPQEPCDWFNGLTHVVNSIPKKQLPVPQATNEVQKKFLVFDQSNDQTTLIYNSTPIQYHPLKPQLPIHRKREELVIEKFEDTRRSNRNFDDGYDDASEMHEDSEELNALLYSDDDASNDEIDYYEDEEERSTGHSPSMLTGSNKHEFVDDKVEEVASSTGFRKRHKLDTGGYDVISLEDTASSAKSGVNCSDEAEFSSCENYSRARIAFPKIESETFPTGKRARIEKVRETISILQNLIPGVKSGKDPMVILDESISYLRILKVKAKALGLDSL